MRISWSDKEKGEEHLGGREQHVRKPGDERNSACARDGKAAVTPALSVRGRRAGRSWGVGSGSHWAGTPSEEHGVYSRGKGEPQKILK